MLVVLYILRASRYFFSLNKVLAYKKLAWSAIRLVGFSLTKSIIFVSPLLLPKNKDDTAS